MSIILDIIVVLLFAGSIIIGAKKGFIKSVLSIAVMLVALFGSYKLYSPLSEYINEKYISAAFEKTESEETDKDDSFATSEESESKLQDGVNELLGLIGVGSEGKSEKQSSHISTDPLTRTVSDGIAFFLIYSVISIVLTAVVNLINLAAKLPIIKQANMLLGLLLGLVRGFFYSWGISYILCIVLPRLAIIYNGISANIINDTAVVKFLGGINIFNLF